MKNPLVEMVKSHIKGGAESMMAACGAFDNSYPVELGLEIAKFTARLDAVETEEGLREFMESVVRWCAERLQID